MRRQTGPAIFWFRVERPVFNHAPFTYNVRVLGRRLVAGVLLPLISIVENCSKERRLPISHPLLKKIKQDNGFSAVYLTWQTRYLHPFNFVNACCVFAFQM